MRMKFVKILLLIFVASYFERSVIAEIKFNQITTSISRRIFSFLSNCTSGAGNIRLIFYSSRSNVSDVRLENPRAVPLNSTIKTVFLIHGFLSDGTKDWVNETISAFLENEPCNIFVVDWRVGACSETIKYLNFQSYSAAAANTKEVGEYVARCIENLVDHYSVLLKDVWIIGHSLGAHVAGFAGKTLKAHRVEKVGRITGLDPAGPLFRRVDATKRLDKTDAIFVEVTHTSSLLGLEEAIGHVDLYFNGGNFQMGCLLNKPGCSHDRAVDYYLEAIRNSNCQFMAKIWSRTEGYKNTPTTCENFCTIVGPLAQGFSARGTFYVQTNNRKPFCRESPSSGTIVEIPADHNPLDENIFDGPF